MKAAIKHLRQSEKRRKVNRMQKHNLKDEWKGMFKLAREKKFDEFQKKLPKVMSLIDKSAKNHLLHPNNAARKKSALASILAKSK